MNTLNIKIGIVSILLFLSIFSLVFFQSIRFAGASAPSGLPATVATTSVSLLTTTVNTLFSTSTCAARIITTSSQGIMLTFSDYSGQSPTALFGHYQAASTTVAYDSGQFGCGLVKAYSFANATATLTETR